MDPSTVKLLFLSVLALGVVVIVALMIVLYLHSVFKEVTDESTRYSPHRREQYQDQRLRTALYGLASILILVLLTPVLIWIL